MQRRLRSNFPLILCPFVAQKLKFTSKHEGLYGLYDCSFAMKDCEVSMTSSALQTLSRTKFYFWNQIVLQKLATVKIVPAVLLHLPLPLLYRLLLLLRPLPQDDEHASKKTKTANDKPSGWAAGMREALVSSGPRGYAVVRSSTRSSVFTV